MGFLRTLLALLVLLLPAAMAQSETATVASTPPTAPGSAQNPISISTTEVIVPVTVTDHQGRFVSNLDLKDFKLYDEGKEQQIAYFSRERNLPVVAGFLIDLSNTNRLRWKEFTEAITELIGAVMPEPKRYSGYLIGYSTEAEVMVDTTNDPEKLVDKARKLKPGGGAALYDAVYMACTSRTLIKGEPIEPRRVIIIVGDGHDNASKKSLEEVVEVAQRNLVTIYGVSTVAFGMTSDGEKNLNRLAEATGGRVVYPLQNLYTDVSGYLSTPSDEGNFALKVGTGGYAAAIMKGIVNAIGTTAGEIQTQYILRYTPTETDANRNFRRIRIVVDLPNVKVRAREGYFPYAP